MVPVPPWGMFTVGRRRRYGGRTGAFSEAAAGAGAAVDGRNGDVGSPTGWMSTRRAAVRGAAAEDVTVPGADDAAGPAADRGAGPDGAVAAGPGMGSSSVSESRSDS
ncbi:hypothetical protein IHE61_27215 [Streptomyces sp. GKU 257-1]|nr:hypothetical protein [Streptomyces sp. GKU 257-1]